MGYSQRDVAKLLKQKSASSISRWEKGVSLPSVENLLKLSFLYRTLCNELYFDLSLEFRDALHEREKRLKENKALPNGP